MKNGNKPAFYVEESISMQGNDGHGLTKREYFAGLAMQGLAMYTGAEPEGVAKYAVDLADALLAELEKPVP